MPHPTRREAHGIYEGHELPPDTRVWAVGQTPLDACRALAAERWGGTVEELGDPLRSRPDDPYDWGFRFYSDGTGFKAAGINVLGGVILTWWK